MGSSQRVNLNTMTDKNSITIQEVTNSTRSFSYRQPMKFGGRVVNDVTVLRTEIAVTRKGSRKKIHGVGEMTMGNAWAWPSKIPDKITLRLMLELADRLAARVNEAKISGDALQVGEQIRGLREQIRQEMITEFKMSDPMPKLAAMVAASPLDAAVHDAWGRAHQRNAFQCLSSEFLNADLGEYLGEQFAGKYPADYVSAAPKPTMPLYHLVGALDPLSEADLRTRLNDGLPETLEEWLRLEGIKRLKIKLDGNDMDWDVGRIVEVTRICERVAPERDWKLSFDFNEQCPNEDYVLDLLERLESLSRLSFERLQYIEQPSPRDLTQRSEFTVHRLSRIRPVVLDEALTDMEALKLARQRGYSGIALKACKGHTDCLFMGAAGAEFNLFTCMQDLTCVGGSFLHSAAIAAHFPHIPAIEGNGRQYCPAGNEAYMEDYAPMFRIRYGTVPTQLLDGPGLGFEWKPL
ncbi:MAG: hypothetical protein KatS3mg111_4249 [Pirellulaceae bacterium]|nr:MAG: hypothetical protein KatS3mg111_4249 [Pirellulaceae bacterium]